MSSWPKIPCPTAYGFSTLVLPNRSGEENKGDILADIETDKTTIEVEATPAHVKAWLIDGPAAHWHADGRIAAPGEGGSPRAPHNGFCARTRRRWAHRHRPRRSDQRLAHLPIARHTDERRIDPRQTGTGPEADHKKISKLLPIRCSATRVAECAKTLPLTNCAQPSAPRPKANERAALLHHQRWTWTPR